MRFLMLLMVALCLPSQMQAACDETFGDLWNISWAEEPRNDLRCKLDSRCKKEPTNIKSEEYDTCCKCKSCAVWEGKEIELFIEYVSVLGRSLVLSDQAPSETDVYKVEQTDAEMTEIPSNLCDWDNETNLKERYPDEFKNIKQFWENIVSLNFENNLIRKIPNINCLVRLDGINMKNNEIKHISNTSFTYLKRLRSINFSGNLIKEIDPNILTSENFRNLFYVDFSHNKMTKLDASNMLSLYPFCIIDYNSNDITEIVNEADLNLDLTITYGPGFVDVSENEMTTWPDFETILNLDDITQLGHLFSFGFDFRNIQLQCDCNIEQFMSRAYNIINAIWRSYMNITCTAPQELVGKLVWEVDPEKFVCPVEIDCDPRCTCIDKPNKNTFFIDCSNSDLKTLPEIPYSRYSHYVSLNGSKNQISRIGNVSYLSRISMLDISENNLVEIDNTVANKLENATYIDISNNPNLRQLPQMFQYHNVCSRNMKHLQISCDCQSVWIEKWVRSKHCQTHNNLFQCEVPEAGLKSPLEFQPEHLDCFPDGFPYLLESLIAAAILILTLIGALIYIFRYELLIVCLRLRQVSSNTVTPMIKYDVFLSFNDTDDDVTKWIFHMLEPQLNKAGYKVFLPTRDVAFGAERDSEIINVLSTTRNFLAVMSDSYLQEADEGMRSWTENEWKYGWNNFKRDKSKNIVLVNFDHVSSLDVTHLQIKAFLRVGCTIDFKNCHRNIMQEIYEKLGKPLQMPKLTGKAFDNRKQKFTQFEIFTIANKDNKLLQNEQPEEVNEHKYANIFTRSKGSHIRKDLRNAVKNSRDLAVSVHSKKCQYRKCYACSHGDNEQQLHNIKVARNSSSIKHLNASAKSSSVTIGRRATSTDIDLKKKPFESETQNLSKSNSIKELSNETAADISILQETEQNMSNQANGSETDTPENTLLFQGKLNEHFPQENKYAHMFKASSFVRDNRKTQEQLDTNNDKSRINKDTPVIGKSDRLSVEQSMDNDDSIIETITMDNDESLATCTETISIASSRRSLNSITEVFV